MNERPPQHDTDPFPGAALQLRPTYRDWLFCNLRFALSAYARRALDRRLRAGTVIPADFFGICAAGAVDPLIDDYLIAQLRALDIQTVRLDYTLPHPEPHEPRILERLLEEGFHVCLHPVGGGASDQPAAAASTADRRMCALADLMARYGTRLAMLELGATVNRRKWYGASLTEFFREYAAGYHAARACKLPVAAPNVTDFEPVYNTVILDIMRRNGLLPQYHSDNLFVERAGEPEQDDHKIAGRRLAGRLKFDLLRKARLLHAVSRWAGVQETISTHAAWSLRRIARFSVEIEQKQADYVSRYCILAATAGVLRHMYWGPLIGQREGLIDDGSDFYPPHIPHVTRYTRVAGKKEDLRRRPAWYAFREVVRRLRGAQFVKAYATSDPALWILEFKRPQGILHITWTRDGRRAWTTDVYPAEQTATASVSDRDGRRLTEAPSSISEAPTFWSWPDTAAPVVHETACAIPGIRFAGGSGGCDYQRLTPQDWTGIAVMNPPNGGAPPDAAVSTILPPPAHAEAFMRNARNQVWQQASPWAPDRPVVVKRLGAPRGIRRVLQFFKPTRARRSWNGAVALLRRGLPTPEPVAFLEQRQHATLNESYYVCEAMDTPHSVRTVFNAYGNGNGNEVTADIPQDLFFQRLAAFLVELHRKGVYFRDLSAGNILVIHNSSPEAKPRISFSLIDTARARFYAHPLDIRRRLCDLMRICHPLDNERRRRLLTAYLNAADIRYRRWMEVPFQFYNAKIRVKKVVRLR